MLGLIFTKISLDHLQSMKNRQTVLESQTNKFDEEHANGCEAIFPHSFSLIPNLVCYKNHDLRPRAQFRRSATQWSGYINVPYQSFWVSTILNFVAKSYILQTHMRIVTKLGMCLWQHALIKKFLPSFPPF